MTLHDFLILSLGYALICGLSLWLASQILP